MNIKISDLQKQPGVGIKPR